MGKLDTVFAIFLLLAGVCRGVLAQDFDITSIGYAEFIQLAQESDPVHSRLQNEALELKSNGAAANSFPDPVVTIGLDDVATEFGVTEETKTVIGIQQTLPSFGMRRADGGSMLAEARAKESEARNRLLEVERGATDAWLELYYAFAAQQLIVANRRIFEEMLRITQSRYRAGRGTQGEVIAAQLEISKIENRVTEFEMTKDMASAQVGNWLGAAIARWEVTPEFPVLGAVPKYESIRESIGEHPSVVAADAMVDAGRSVLDLARSRYWPETMVSLTYSKRDIDESAMVAAMLSFSVPLFPPRRQDRWVNAGRARVDGAKDEAKGRLRELQIMLEEQYRRWRRLNELLQRFEKELLPYASQYSQATLNSYQSAIVEFDTLVEARVQELDTKLEALRLQVDRAKAQAALNYLAGRQSNE